MNNLYQSSNDDTINLSALVNYLFDLIRVKFLFKAEASKNIFALFLGQTIMRTIRRIKI